MTKYSINNILHGAFEWPDCCLCKKKIDNADAVDAQVVFERAVQVRFYCHGQIETFTITNDQIQDHADALRYGGKGVIKLPARVFLQRVAEYRTTTKPERRRLP